MPLAMEAILLKLILILFTGKDYLLLTKTLEQKFCLGPVSCLFGDIRLVVGEETFQVEQEKFLGSRT